MTLFKSTSIYTISKLINQAIPFLLLPILTNYLTPGDYGIISIFNTTLAFLIIFISLGIPSLVGVELVKKSKKEFSIFITNSLILSMSIAIIISLILLIFGEQISRLINLNIEWLFLVVLISLFKIFFNIYLIILRFENRIILNVTLELLQVLINVFFSLLFIIVLLMSWEGRAIGITIASILFGMISIYKFYFTYFKKQYIAIIHMKEILKFSTPIIPHHIAIWVRGGFDIILITTLLNSTQAGIYSIGFQLSAIVGLFASSFLSAFTPYLYHKLQKNSESERKNIVFISYIFFASMLLISFIVAMLYNWLIPIYIDAKYSEVNDIIYILLLANAFLGMYYIVSTYIFYEKKTYLLSKITIIISFFHVLISFILINFIGIKGAAIAILITYLISFIAVWSLSNKIYPMPWFIKKSRFIKKN